MVHRTPFRVTIFKQFWENHLHTAQSTLFSHQSHLSSRTISIYSGANKFQNTLLKTINAPKPNFCICFLKPTASFSKRQLYTAIHLSCTKSNPAEPSDPHTKEEKMKEYKENIYTIPNFLTLGRFLVSPYLGYCVVQGEYVWACSLFVLASITDLVDGYIARHWKGQATMIGTVLDPMADKFMISILAGTLAYAKLVPLWLVVLILSRDVFLVTKGFYLRYQTLPRPVTFKRYWDFSRPTAEVKPSTLSKVNTNLQVGLFACCLAAPVFGITADHYVLSGLYGITALTTTCSLLDYMINKPYKLYDQRNSKEP